MGCSKETFSLFASDEAEALAKEFDIPFLGSIPIDTVVTLPTSSYCP